MTAIACRKQTPFATQKASTSGVFRRLVTHPARMAVVLGLWAVSVPSASRAQVCDTVALCQETLSSDFFGVDARALAMGNTGIALGHDGSAMIYNPANLARIKRIELRAGLSHQKLDNETSFFDGASSLPDGQDITKTRINSITLTAPVPTYRGSLVFGFGLNRVNSFDRAFGVQYLASNTLSAAVEGISAREHETGGMWKWTAAGAVDISPRVSAGLSLHLLTGKDEYRYMETDDRSPNVISLDQSIDVDYVGISATGGLSYAASPNVTAGIVIETPTFIAAEETAFLVHDTAFSDYIWEYGPSFADYNLTKPFVFGFGLGAQFDQINLVGDIRYTDWSQLDIDYDDPILEPDETAALLFIDDYLTEVVSIHLGGELILPQQGMSVRAGYFFDPLPLESRYVASDRQYITAGLGFLIDRVMTLDIAYVHGGYELRDASPGFYFADYKTRRLFLTFGYRI
jgi:long-subunit fatty acid transport protein